MADPRPLYLQLNADVVSLNKRFEDAFKQWLDTDELVDVDDLFKECKRIRVGIDELERGFRYLEEVLTVIVRLRDAIKHLETAYSMVFPRDPDPRHASQRPGNRGYHLY